MSEHDLHRYIQHRMDRIEHKIDHLEERLNEAEVRMATMNQKIRNWAALGGFIAGIVSAIISTMAVLFINQSL